MSWVDWKRLVQIQLLLLNSIVLDRKDVDGIPVILLVDADAVALNWHNWCLTSIVNVGGLVVEAVHLRELLVELVCWRLLPGRLRRDLVCCRHSS
jgi:hypothetical protein